MLMAVLMIASLVPATALAASADCDHADTFSYSIEKNTAAKQPGITVEVCNECGHVAKDVVVPFAEAKDIVKCAAAGHEWKTVELQKASCDKVGVKLTYCANCGTEKAPIVPDKSALGAHDYEFTVVVKPTCNKEGWGYAVCKICKHIEFVAGVEGVKELIYAAYENGDIANTVYNNAIAMFAMTNSQHKLTDLKAVTENTVVADKNDSTKEVTLKPEVKATHTLTVSGQVAIAADGKVTVEAIAGGHPTTKAYNWVKKLDSNGKRTVDVYASVLGGHGTGYTGDVVCPDCGYYELGHTVAGLNNVQANPKHVMTLKSLGYYPYVDANGARHDGVTDVWYCEVCGYIGGEKLAYDEYVDYTVYAAQGDVRVFGAKEAHCWEAGNTGVKKMYDGKKWVDIDVNNNNKEITVEHNFVLAEGKAATCTKNGYTYDNYYVCANVKPDGTPCPGHKGDATQIITKAKGHTEAVKVLVAPTCSSEGMSVKYCSVCNAYLTNGELATDDPLYQQGSTTPAYYTIKAVPHTAGDPVNAKEATCTEVGYTGDKVCKWCGTMLEKGKEIPMKEHTSVEVKAVEATCTTDGMKAGTKCSVCDKVLTGCEKIDKLGHDFKDGKCTRCDAPDPNYKPEVKNPFTDVKEGDEFYEDILWAADKNIVDGIKAADGTMTFQANGKLTRAQVVQMLWNANGKPEAKAAANFSDIAADAWYAKAIAWAVEAGVINGMGDGTFAPDAECTRAQFVKMLWVINGSPKVDAADFSDVAADAWYAQAVAWAAAQKVTLGDGAGHFLPDDTCTRGQAVAFLHRAPALTVTAAK